MLYLDTKYISLVSYKLQKFKKSNKTYNFRCPYCGDSQKNKNRARGYFFQKKGSYIYKCHNCGVGRSLANFLKDNDTALFSEYVLEAYKDGASGKGTNVPNPEFNFKPPVFEDEDIFSELKKLSDLNKTHAARKIIEGRKLPPDLFYYCPNFKEWTNKHKKVFEDTQHDEPRIIIPLKDNNGIIGYQGRSLSSTATIRYITVILDESKTKIYGLDRVNDNETIYVTEGPFDSHFVRNAIAMCGSDADISSFNNNYVFIYDNEPRNREICDKIQKTINLGYPVVIFPSDIKEKDLNDMVLAGHDVQTMVESNIYQGLKANLKFTHWKKV